MMRNCGRDSLQNQTRVIEDGNINDEASLELPLFGSRVLGSLIPKECYCFSRFGNHGLH
jgi:hypothetical protein